MLRDRVESPTRDFLVQPRKLTKTYQTVQNEVIEMVGREFRVAVLKVGSLQWTMHPDDHLMRNQVS